MTKEEKAAIIEGLVEKFQSNGHFYITDAGGLSVAKINTDFSDKVLKGFSGVIFSQENGKLPAQILIDYRKKSGKDKPLLKGASIDRDVFVGDDQLKTLSQLKSKQELVGEIIGLLQSPATNVISALQSGKHTLAGLVKTLSERES